MVIKDSNSVYSGLNSISLRLVLKLKTWGVDNGVAQPLVEARWPSGKASDSGPRGRGLDPHSDRRVVSLSEIHLPPKKYW